ncbi:unknown [Eggerthella sp. CAG:209]|nr:unknown [Eggerthella sp. CAG:209]
MARLVLFLDGKLNRVVDGLDGNLAVFDAHRAVFKRGALGIHLIDGAIGINLERKRTLDLLVASRRRCLPQLVGVARDQSRQGIRAGVHREHALGFACFRAAGKHTLYAERSTRNCGTGAVIALVGAVLGKRYLDGVVYRNEAQVVAVQQVLTIRDTLIVRSPFVDFAVK